MLPLTLALVGIIAGLGLITVLGVLLGPVNVRSSFRPPQYSLSNPAFSLIQFFMRPASGEVFAYLA